MKKRKLGYLALFCLIFSVVLTATVKAPTDGTTATLWTTDIAGLGEKNGFSLGETVYLKTADSFGNYPITPGNYTIYVLVGNINGPPTPSQPQIYLPDQPKPLGFTRINITTDSNGRFGTPVSGGWAIPIPIWIAQATGEFTVILDQTAIYDGGNPSIGIGSGYWNYDDYREDICSAAPPPSSFFVIPEVGTMLLGVAMFGAFASYMLLKNKKTP